MATRKDSPAWILGKDPLPPALSNLPAGPAEETLDEKIDRILSLLLDRAMCDDDRLKVIDRVLKKRVIDSKIKDAKFGSAFDEGD